MNKRLSYRAREIEAWVENHLVDENGILYTFADRTTGKLLSNDLLDSIDPMRLRNSTTAGWWAYENCSMVTGAYMEAMLCRYEVEGDIAALARARRCFHGLRHIYELGKTLEEGFMPKIYDNRFTPDTSSDQVLFAMSALDHFHPHATPAEQAEISHMIGQMVRFFVKRDYKYTFYEMQDMAWPLARFTSKNLMAYRHTGDDYFKKEYERLLALGVNERPGEEYLRPKLAGLVKRSDTEIEVGGWILTIPLYCATMDLMELEYLLRQDPSNPWAGKWRRSIFQMWNEGALSITEDGRAYYSVVVDFETLEVRLLESKFAGNPPSASSDVAMPDSTVSQLEMPFDANKWSGFAFMLYSHSARTSMSTLYARAGLQVAPLFPKDVSIRPVARRIIEAFDLYDLTYFEGPDSFHPRFKYMMNVMSTDSVANWLWGYWQGRAINVFAADE